MEITQLPLAGSVTLLTLMDVPAVGATGVTTPLGLAPQFEKVAVYPTKETFAGRLSTKLTPPIGAAFGFPIVNLKVDCPLAVIVDGVKLLENVNALGSTITMVRPPGPESAL
ncbi:MAG: hypothetical protein KDI71_18395 [Xanthomonadales bacterium]|nr:hypothetical protein [Xanthomonadales bacterium]